MVKQFQVGKRYRWFNTAQDATEYLCLAAIEVHGVHMGVLEHPKASDPKVIYKAFTARADHYEIVPPKPRTGKGILIKYKQGDIYPFIVPLEKAEKYGEGIYDKFSIEWTEIVNDKDSAG